MTLTSLSIFIRTHPCNASNLSILLIFFPLGISQSDHRIKFLRSCSRVWMFQKSISIDDLSLENTTIPLRWRTMLQWMNKLMLNSEEYEKRCAILQRIIPLFISHSPCRPAHLIRGSITSNFKASVKCSTGTCT